MPIEPVKTVIEKFGSLPSRDKVRYSPGLLTVKKRWVECDLRAIIFGKESEKPDVSGSDFTGRVAVDVTLLAVLAGDVTIGATSPVVSASVEPVKSFIENLRFTSEPGRGSVPIGVADGPEEMGRVQPARNQKSIQNKSDWPE